MKKPLWLRSNLISCPECGHLTEKFVDFRIDSFKKGFDCKFCNYHCSEKDFWEDYEFKAGRELDFGYNDIDGGKYV